MSILIKGIDMPKDIDELRLIINGMSIAIEPTKVIQIPTPHGRLIDADVLQRKKNKKNFDGIISDMALFYLNYYLEEKGQTILEAEE